MQRWSRAAMCAAVTMTVPALVAVGSMVPDAASNVARAVHGVSVLVASTAMWLSARHGDPRLRRSRVLFAAALLAGAAGFAISAAYEAVLGYVPTPALSDLAALIWAPCAVLGLVLLPAEPNREGGRLRAVCDSVVAGSSLLLCSWMLALEPIYETTTQTALAKATFLAYPVVDIIVAVTALSVAANARHDMRRLLRLVTSGLVLIGISDSGSAVALATNNDAFSWISVVLQAGLVCLFWAAVLPGTGSRRVTARFDNALDTALPFLPVVATTAVGLNYIITGQVFGATEAVIAAVMIGGLLGRQLLYARHVGAIAYRMSVDAAEDSLTRLPNRRTFLSVLDTSLATFPPGKVAVVILDLDGFKEINDSFGHAAGDTALIDFAGRLKELAGARCTAARLGGDEFALLITGEDAEMRALTGADRLTNPRRAQIGAALRSVGASAGIAVNRPGDTTSSVLRRADLAMYEAKLAGQARTAIFQDEMACRAERRNLLMRALPGAADRGELRLVYQPLFRLSDRTVAGTEALLRWHHPLHGNVPPDEFIPLAEEIGVIGEIGEWVLNHAAQHMSQWRMAGRHVPHLFVNVSPHEFTPSFVPTVLETLHRFAIAPDALTVEITESALPDLRANQALQDLRDAGIRIAMDDFGAGFSSLAQLALLPVDTLKIDRDFMRGIDTPNGRRIVRAMIMLAADLGLGTVAEGVEHASEAEIIQEAGCLFAQGYHFARPLSPEDMAALLPATSASEALPPLV